MKIKAAIVREKGKPFQFEEVDLQSPKKGEVLVKIRASGVCHTDEVAQNQMIPVPLPAVLGHEGCGIVEEVGEEVTEIEKGAILMTGGTHEGNYYQPTVLKDVTPDMRIFYEESFGPVTSIIKAKNAEDAVRLCNDNEYGLSSSLLTNDLSKAMELSLLMEAGMVHINNATVADNSTVAFGGIKNSGVGREGGAYSIEEFTELKWITVQYKQAVLPF